jgi:hypothetical protein
MMSEASPLLVPKRRHGAAAGGHAAGRAVAEDTAGTGGRIGGGVARGGSGPVVCQASLVSGHVGVVRRQRRQQRRMWACALNDDDIV